MNSLNDSDIAQVLEKLHEDAARDSERRARRSPERDDALIRMGELYLSVSQAEGNLLYLLARGSRAAKIVEFGASFGISTTYLGAAARDNGGRVITTEVHPEKCKALRRTLLAAGLGSVVTVLEGDARETLRTVDGPVDFVFLDGWKGMYRPVLELLLPKLRLGALVVADNVDLEAAQDYAQHVRTDPSFVSYTLGKQELSCFTG
ncbi:MAG TPA: class I SAM-dependent methyltransferase [Gammaproteobacteria bacterium]|nr:class I SAM-dependent methyltransferase [Gammaproteobacteria bacterium]